MTHQLYRTIALTLAALSLAGLTAGCSAEQKETAKQLCKEHPAECADLVNALDKVPAGQPGAAQGQTPAQPQAQLTPQQVNGDQVPEALLAWSRGQSGGPQLASKVVIMSDAIYVGLSGGLRHTGGYAVKLTGDLRREGDGWVADAQLISPAPGGMVTQVLTTPSAFYKLPKVGGPIQVRFGIAAPATTTPPAPPAADIPREQVWSQNFRVNGPRLLSDGKLFLEGTARAFEAVFRVEVWAGGKLLLAQPVQTTAGGPEFGRFEVTLTVPGGVPGGAEVRYQIPSMKDGSVTTELTLPVSE